MSLERHAVKQKPDWFTDDVVIVVSQRHADI